MAKFASSPMSMTIGGETYTIEFNREAIKLAATMGVTNDTASVFERVKNILYCGLKKHHPFITPKRTEDIIDQAMSEGYGLNSFSEVTDEFGRCYQAVFTESEEVKSKPLITRL